MFTESGSILAVSCPRFHLLKFRVHDIRDYSHAAPRTPLESPYWFFTSLVSTRSENTQLPHSLGHIRIQPFDVGHAAAQHDDIRVEDVDDVCEGAREAVLVGLQAALAGGIALLRTRHDFFRATRLRSA